MKSVFVVQHEYEWCGHDETKFVGVYATKLDAETAVARLRKQPGFCDWPDDFSVEEYELGKDCWEEGFSIMLNILVPLSRKEDEYHCVGSVWRPGDVYEISAICDADPSSLAFKVGDLVRCEERFIEGEGKVLVAIELVSDERNS